MTTTTAGSPLTSQTSESAEGGKGGGGRGGGGGGIEVKYFLAHQRLGAGCVYKGENFLVDFSLHSSLPPLLFLPPLIPSSSSSLPSPFISKCRPPSGTILFFDRTEVGLLLWLHVTHQNIQCTLACKQPYRLP